MEFIMKSRVRFSNKICTTFNFQSTLNLQINIVVDSDD